MQRPPCAHHVELEEWRQDGGTSGILKFLCSARRPDVRHMIYVNRVLALGHGDDGNRQPLAHQCPRRVVNWEFRSGQYYAAGCIRSEQLAKLESTATDAVVVLF